MRVDIKTMPELRVASVRHRGPYSRIGEAFAILSEIAGRAGLFGPDTLLLGIYHDDPKLTAQEELRSDAGITVSPDATLPAELDEQRIPAGRYAVTTHIGPYATLVDTWEQFMQEWLPHSGNRFGEGVSYEVYRNTPGDVPEDQLHTDIFIPVVST